MRKRTDSLKKQLKSSQPGKSRVSSSFRVKGNFQKSRREVSAGGLVYKRTSRGVLFAMILDGYGKWTFSKGHVRRGEKLVETARREVCEETSLCNLKYVARLGKIDIWFRDRFVYKGMLIHKDIHYFLFETDARARVRVPEKTKKLGETIVKVAWVPAEKLLEQSSYDDLKPLIRRAIAILKKKKIL